MTERKPEDVRSAEPALGRAAEPVSSDRSSAVAAAASQVRRGFITELRRRGVIETAVAYVVLGWLLLQVADVAFDQLSLPSWAGTFVAYLVVVGFPISLVIAWFFELTVRGRRVELQTDASDAGRPLGAPTIAIGAALAIAAIGVFVFDQYVGLPERETTAVASASFTEAQINPSSIAVLPFFNISDTDEGRIFANGLTEDVINRLARVPGLRVSSRGDSYALASNAASADVRRRLRVAYYIEGSVRVSSDMLRVVVQLIDSATGFHIVSRSFDRDRTDFFELQDEITQLAVANLRVALPEATRTANTGLSAAGDLDAYVLYRSGMDALYRPRTEASIEEALRSFARSLEVDADYAAGHAGTCLAYVALYLVTLDPEHIGTAEASCDAALALNDNLDVVHNALGELYYRTGAYEAAEEAFRRALAINPSAVDSLIGLGDVYLGQQRATEAEAAFAQAIGLKPGNWSAYNAYGGFLYLTGRYGDAAAQYREIISLDPENITGWTNLASALLLSGNFAAASNAFEQTIRIEPTSTAYSNLGLLHYYSGDFEAAVRALRAASDLTPNNFLVWSNLGDVLSFSEDSGRAAEAAFERAEELAEDRLRVNSRDPQTIANLAWIKAMLGDAGDAETLIATARDIAAEDPYIHYIEALILVKRGANSDALDRLSTAVRLGYPRVLIAAEPHLIPIRSAAQFDRLIEPRQPLPR